MSRIRPLACAAMTRLERMVMREIIPNFLIGVGLFVGLVLLWRVLAQPFVSMLPARAFLPWMLYQIPNFALQAFPIAAVFTALMVFGRLARENELLAAQGGGISLARVARPVLLFGALIAGLGYVVSEFIAPKANEQVSVTWWDGVSGNALSRIAGKRILGDNNQTVYFESVAGEELRNVRLETWSGAEQRITAAETARFNGQRLEMRGWKNYTLNHNFFPDPNSTYNQNWATNAIPFVNYAPNPQSKQTVLFGKTKERAIAENDGGGFEDPRSVSDLWREHQSATGAAQRELAALLGFKTALPFASLVILLFGVAVAARGARNSSVAFGYTVLIAIGFYAALFLGRTLGQVGILPAFLAPWLANVGFLAAGVWLLRSREIR
jgi:lipopolysaccharide export LptBFGC system permease protein LptF